MIWDKGGMGGSSLLCYMKVQLEVTRQQCLPYLSINDKYVNFCFSGEILGLFSWVPGYALGCQDKFLRWPF